MTAITASRGHVRTTRFERALLSMSAGLDHFVSHRLARRAGAQARKVAAARTAAVDRRAVAEAYGAWGIPPR